MSSQPPRIGGGLFSKPRPDPRKAGESSRPTKEASNSAASISLPKTASPQAMGTADSLFSPPSSSSVPGIFGSSHGSDGTAEGSVETNPPPPPPPPPPVGEASHAARSDEKSSEVVEISSTEKREASAAADSVLKALRSVIDSGDESTREQQATEATNVATPSGEVKVQSSGTPSRYVSSHKTPKAINASSNPFGVVSQTGKVPSPRATASRYVNPFPPEIRVTSEKEVGSKELQVETGGHMKHPSQRHIPEEVQASSDPFGTIPRPRTESGSLMSPGLTSPRYVNPFPEAMHKPLGSPQSGIVMPTTSAPGEGEYQPRQALDAKALFSEDDWTSFIPAGGDRKEAEERPAVPWDDNDGVEEVEVLRELKSGDHSGHSSVEQAPSADLVEAPVGSKAKEPSKPAVGTEVEEEPSVPAAGTKAEEPSVPAAGAKAEEPSAPAAGTKAEKPSVPAVGTKVVEEPSRPALGKEFVVPAAGSGVEEEPLVSAAKVEAQSSVMESEVVEEQEQPSILVAGESKAERQQPSAVVANVVGELHSSPAAAGRVPEGPSVPSRGDYQKPSPDPALPSSVPTAASLFEDSTSPIDFVASNRPSAVSFSSLVHSREEPSGASASPKEESEVVTAPSAVEDTQPSTVQRSQPSAPSVPGVVFGFGGSVFEVSGERVESKPLPAEVVEEIRSYPGPFTRSTPKAVVQQYCEEMLHGSSGDEEILWKLLAALAREDTSSANWQEKVQSSLLGAYYDGADSLVRLCWAATDEGKLDDFVRSETEDIDWASVLALASMQGSDKFRHFMSVFGERGIATAHSDARGSPARPILQLLLQSFTGQGPLNDEVIAESLDLWPLAAVLCLRMAATDRAVVALRRLADALMHAGRVPAADVCYTLGKLASGAKQMFDPVDDPNALMSMLLVDPRDISKLSRILQPRALHASEVLEYVGPAVVEPSLIPFKFVYAQRLAECGLLDQASAYCREVYQYMGDQPSGRYSQQLRSLVGDFGRRLTMHRRYVTEAELCTSDYKLDESDSRGIWGGLKSLAGASMQTTPESTWAKPQTAPLKQPAVPPRHDHQRSAGTVPPPLQVPTTAQPPITQPSPAPEVAITQDAEANPFAQPTVSPPRHQQQQQQPHRGQWSEAPRTVSSAPTGVPRPTHAREGSLPGSGSLMSPVATHATPTGFNNGPTVGAVPSNPATKTMATGPSYPPHHRQGSVVSPLSGRAQRLPSGAFSNAGLVSPPAPMDGQQPGFFNTQQQQQQQYGYGDSMPPPGGRPPLIPPNQQWGSRPRVQTPDRTSNGRGDHSDALESAGKYLGGLLGGLKSAVAGISESLAGPTQPEGDPYALGEENTFYYDEVRKEWRQRGQPEGQLSPTGTAAPPPPAAPLAPPPTGYAPTQRKQYTRGNYVDIMRFG